jgi:hypothetical protein
MDTNIVLQLNRAFNKKKFYKESPFVDFVFEILNRNIEIDTSEEDYSLKLHENTEVMSISERNFDYVRSIQFEGKGEDSIISKMIVESKNLDSGSIEIELKESDVEDLMILIEEDTDNF